MNSVLFFIKCVWRKKIDGHVIKSTLSYYITSIPPRIAPEELYNEGESD